MLVTPHELFARALNMQYAIGAFNTSNLEVTQAIFRAAEQKKAPVIIQTSEGAIEYAGLRELSCLVRTIADDSSIPIVLHLDHGKSLATVKACIESGFTSVMIDASSLEFRKNVELTRQVADYAHARGVWVEAELGSILGDEGAKELAGKTTPEEMFTDPKLARQFIKQTGADALAVSVGTIHGAFTGQEYIRFELLEQIQKVIPDVPLVLHGASGLANEHLAEAVSTNVCKVNVDTELRIAFEQAVRTYFKNQHDKIDPRDILGPAREAVQEVAMQKIEVLGSANKAIST